MRKIKIQVSNDSLVFSYYETIEFQPNLMNTNIIENNELVFSDEYIKINKKIFTLFLKDLILEHKIDTIKITEYELVQTIMGILIQIDIKKLIILEDKALPFEICESLVDIKSLEYINCYSIPPYMIEILDRNNLIVETRVEVFFSSDFMEINNLNQYSKLFYKTSLRIEKMFSESDNDDFVTFTKINRYLKTINLYIFDEDMIIRLADILHDARIKNIRILLHKNIDSKSEAENLKNLKKKLKNKYNLYLKIVYSEKYLKDNIFKQVLLNILKTCSIVIFLIVVATFGSILFNNYLSSKNADKISEEINEVIADKKDEVPKPTEPTEEEPPKISEKYNALLEVNNETVGWLKINNTKIDYPIVKAPDNEFYLNHDYYKKKEYNGWVFMDYRNSVEELNKNTILYGHNRYYSGVVFGTLNNVLKNDWYAKDENLIISFDTLYEKLNWQIFSIYRIKTTSDYIQTQFKNDNEYSNFINMIMTRSINDFKVPVNAHSKILTLSTCLDNDQRLVVHAVLMK